MAKQWFEDWKITYDADSKVEVDLPNAIGKNYYAFYLNPEDASDLSNVLMSAFDQIQKDNGGYKK